MRQFSLFALLWCVTTICLMTVVNLKSRSYQVTVWQPGISETTVHMRGFPIEYYVYIPAYQQLFWILANSAIVFVPSYLLFRASQWLVSTFKSWAASDRSPNGS